MANENRVEIIIHADGTASIRALDQVGDAHEKAERRVKASSSAISGAWAKMGAAAMAYLTIQKAWEAVQLGAKAEQAEESFRRVAAASGQNANQILADMSRVAAGTVDDSDIMQKAVKGMALGLQGDQMVKIMEAARIAARLTGEEVAQSYEKIVDAISSNMPRALRQYGLLTKEQAQLIEQANALGVAIDTYTFAMKNAEVQAAQLNITQRSNYEGLQRLKALYQNVKEFLGSLILETVNFWSAVFLGSERYTAQAEKNADQAKKDLDAMTAKLKAEIEAKKEEQKILQKEEELRRILQDQAARAELLGLEDEELEIARLRVKQEEELIRMIDARATADDIANAEALHNAEKFVLQNKFARENEKRAIEQSNSLFAARREAEEESLKAWIDIGKTMDDYALKTGKITEMEAIRRKYQWERAGLETQILTLIQKEPKSAEEAIRIRAQLNDLLAKEAALGKYETAETNILKINQAQKLLDLKQRERDLTQSQYEASWALMMQNANLMGGEAGKWSGTFMSGMKGAMDLEVQADQHTKQMDQLRSQYTERLALMGWMNQEEINMLRAMKREEQNLVLEDLMIRAGMEGNAAEFRLQQEVTVEQRKYQMTLSYTNMVAGALGALLVATGQNNMAFFLLAKGLAIAQAIINTELAATAAMANAALWGGPIGAAAAAASMRTMGYLSVALIAATTLAGMGAQSSQPSAGVPAPTGGYGYEQPTAPAWKQEEKVEGPRPLVVNVHVYGSLMGSTPDEISRTLIPYIRKAESDRV